MKIVHVEAIPLSIPCRYGAEGWSLGSGGWKALDAFVAIGEQGTG